MVISLLSYNPSLSPDIFNVNVFILFPVGLVPNTYIPLKEFSAIENTL